MKRFGLLALVFAGVAAFALVADAPAGPAVGAHSGYRSGGAGFAAPVFVPAPAMPAPATPAMGVEFAPSPPRTGGEEEQEPTAPAFIQANVPANAELWLDGKKMNQTGPSRLYMSPPLERGKTFAYEVRVHWTTPDGTTVDLTRMVRVQAGRQTNVNVAGQ